MTPDPTPVPLLSSRADVITDAPARYAKQLVSHLGRKVEFVHEPSSAGDGWTARVAGSLARITVGDGVLVLQAEAPDPEGLARLEGALGNHLERFGQRHPLTVTWQRSPTPAA
jgi:hypothetical protein